MRVKNYVAENMQEAMARVRTELGRDAMILQTRRFKKGGFLGMFGHPMVEVTAAVDDITLKQPRGRNEGAAAVTSLPTNTISYTPPKEENNKLLAIQIDIAQMRKSIDQLVKGVTSSNKALPQIHQILIQNDVEPKVAEALMEQVQERCGYSMKDDNITRQFLHSKIVQYLSSVEAIKLDEHKPKIAAFVGPTGVGKTTTIAKLAAQFALREHKRVTLITADTYRIAAVDQLKTYGEIMGLPVEVVFTPEEMKSALFKHEDKDLILIDTAGRSPKNSYQLNELHALLTANPFIEVHLVLSATTKYKDSVEIVDSFATCAPKKFLFTKLDESDSYGMILNLMYLFPSTLSYVTTGQNVPDDFELADPYKLAAMIMRE